jgi:hypothetical protein
LDFVTVTAAVRRRFTTFMFDSLVAMVRGASGDLRRSKNLARVSEDTENLIHREIPCRTVSRWEETRGHPDRLMPQFGEHFFPSPHLCNKLLVVRRAGDLDPEQGSVRCDASA